MDGLAISVTTSIAFASLEDKTSEKISAAIPWVSGVPLSEKDAYAVEIVRPAGNEPQALTTYLYNVSKIDGVNERNHLVATVVTETASDRGAVARTYPIRGLFLGTESTIKVGMKFSIAHTGSALTCYARIQRASMV
jgi:hypothetical protein